MQQKLETYCIEQNGASVQSNLKSRKTEPTKMAIWFIICDIRGHSTSECWYKPKTSTYNKYNKEIRKENGKLKKKYSLIPQHNRIPIEERNTTRRSRSKSPTPQKEEAVSNRCKT